MFLRLLRHLEKYLQTLIKFNFKIIFVFSDPAGGNIIMSLIDNLLLKDKIPEVDFKVFSNLEGIIDKSYEKYIIRIPNNLNLIQDEILRFKPEEIFTTTSNNNFEHNWRKVAKKINVRVKSFVDHWTGIRKRFRFNEEEIFPNIIYLIDEEAKRIAIEEGINKNLIVIKENPYYEKVKNFKPNYSKEIFFSKLKITNNKKIILYISDDIKNKSIFKFLGFNEFTILEDILNSINSLKESKKLNVKDYFFLIKLHPRAKKNKFFYYEGIFKNLGLDFRIIKNFDPLEINYFSDFVLGMFSNMVIESFLMRKKLLRIQTGIRTKDPLGFDNLNGNFVKKIENLDSSLFKLLCK